jgi:RNA polymerase sigma-70 factor, ECF subfamily
MMDNIMRLLQDHGAALRLYARQWLGNCAAADDVVQDAIVACWQQDPGLIKTKLTQVYIAVRNTAFNHKRGERRREARELFVATHQPPYFICPQGAQDTRDEVERALVRLPELQREVVTMHIWGGLTFTEIGQVLDCSANTAASRYRYALTALRELLSTSEVNV